MWFLTYASWQNRDIITCILIALLRIRNGGKITLVSDWQWKTIRIWQMNRHAENEVKERSPTDPLILIFCSALLCFLTFLMNYLLLVKVKVIASTIIVRWFFTLRIFELRATYGNVHLLCDHCVKKGLCYYRLEGLEEPMLGTVGWVTQRASWTCFSFSVITSSNRNLSGRNLEYRWGATVCTHTRKMGEIAPGVPPQGAKTCFVFFVTCIKPTRPFGFGHLGLSCTDFDHFLKERGYTQG